MEQYDLILDEFNQTEVPFDREKTVLDLFLDCVKKYPDNTAIIYDGRRYTYRDVDEITTRLACRILNEGGTKGMVASVLIPRCEYMPIVPLALLKAGMTYVPLDCTYPEERLDYIIGNSGSQFIIATAAEASLVQSSVKTILLPEPQCCAEIKGWDDAAKSSLRKATADDLLTILYTSGTTGAPKGTLIPHMSAIVLSDFMRRKFRLSESDIYGSYCSYGFDVCNMDLFLAMTCGAALCIVPEEIKLNLDALHDYLNSNEVSVVYFPTAIGSRYVSMCDSGTLRCVLIAGEKLLPWGRVYDDCEVYNCYGPTEAFDFNSCYLVKGDETDIPIGKPNDNTHFYILSENGDRVGIAEEGEICIAGPQVTRGYLNLPERTAKVFTPNPYAGGDYGVLYHTGDLGYYREDGNMMVIGRRDTQVKIRGNRLELKEVESAVRLYPGVEDAVVDAKTLPDGRKVLVAYVVSKEDIPAKDLCRFVGEHKPSYMIPSAVMQLDTLPLNQNGKVNRKQLPMPEMLSDSGYAAPRNQMEERLCDAYSVVLGIGQVGIDDDFIELGGDSLTVMSVVELCHDIPGLNANVLISNGTVRKVSAVLNGISPHLTIDTTPRTDYPVLDVYEGTFEYCTSIPENTILHEELGVKIDKAIDVERLRHAIIKAVDNHPGLKARFRRNADGELRMYRNDNDEVQVSVRTASEAEFEEIKNGFIRFFDMRVEPLYRFEIILTEENTYFLMDIHHLVTDGRSMDILLDDISDAYMGKPLQPEEWTIFDAVAYQKQLIGSPLYEEGRAWFENTFGSLTCDILPAPDVENPSDVLALEEYRINLPMTRDELEKCCARLNTTFSILTQCAFACTLGKHTGQDEVLFVSTVDGRGQSEIQRTSGYFAMCEPVYCKCNVPLRQMLHEATKMRLLCMAHHAFPFMHLSNGVRLLSKNLFQDQTSIGKHQMFCGFKSSLFNFHKNTSSFNLSVDLYLLDDMQTISAHIIYNKNQYTPALITCLADDFVQGLESFTE